MAQAVIEACGLGKNFGAMPVLRSVDLRVEAGGAAIVTGVNGAGKSTLIRLLAALSEPSAGRAMLFGEEARSLSAEKRRRLGLVTHQSFLYRELTARENLEFYGSLYGMRSARSAADRWLERVGLVAAADERVRGLSRGMEQRLSLARAMIADPDVLLMDEPFAGLDSQGVSIGVDLIKEAVARGCAVLITAHGPAGIEGLESQRLELNRGRLAVVKQETRTGRLRSLFGGSGA
jgi:heme exporter protein A